MCSQFFLLTCNKKTACGLEIRFDLIELNNEMENG